MRYVIVLRTTGVIEKQPIDSVNICVNPDASLCTRRIGRLIGGDVESADTVFDGIMLLYDIDGAVSDKRLNRAAAKIAQGNDYIFGDAVLAACDGQEFFAFDEAAADILMSELAEVES